MLDSQSMHFFAQIIELQKATDITRLDDVMALEAVVENMLISLRRLHNHLIPVHQLPAELLCNIFEFNRSHNHRASNSISLSRVCHRWRQEAISLPSMWTEIVVFDEPSDLLQLCLERSQNAPLDVVIKIPDDPEDEENISENILLLVQHRQRIRLMSIDTPQDSEFILDHLDFAVPALEQFYCKSRQKKGELAVGPFLPDVLFGGCTPSLRKVSMTNMQWTILKKFSNLTDIRLKTHISRVEVWDEGSCLELLERSPNLERLDLTGFWFEPNGSYRPLIILPKLTAISLLKTRSRILSYIGTPNISRVIIRKPKYPVPVPVPYFLPDEPSLFSITCHLAQLKIVTDMEHGPTTFRVQGKTESETIALDLSMQYGHTSVLGVLEYLSTTSLTHLTTLIFDWPLRYSAPSEYAMHALFTNLPSVRNLIFPHLIRDDFLRPLANCTTLCPDLESISVEVSTDIYEKTVRALAAITSARAAMGKTVRVSVAAVKGDEGAFGRII